MSISTNEFQDLEGTRRRLEESLRSLQASYREKLVENDRLLSIKTLLQQSARHSVQVKSSDPFRNLSSPNHPKYSQFCQLFGESWWTKYSILQTLHMIDINLQEETQLIQDLAKRISNAEATLTLILGSFEKNETLNEEGLPFVDIQEDVSDFIETGPRATGLSPTFIDITETPVMTMEEIDALVDELQEEEIKESLNHMEDGALEPLPGPQTELAPVAEQIEQLKIDPTSPPIEINDFGLETAYIDGGELLSKLVRDSKHRYNVVSDTWTESSDVEDEVNSEDEYNDDYCTDEGDYEEEEDEYGRSRGYLIPPNLAKSDRERRVRFSSIDQPATPSFQFDSTASTPLKSALKLSSSSSEMTPSSTEISTSKTSHGEQKHHSTAEFSKAFDHSTFIAPTIIESQDKSKLGQDSTINSIKDTEKEEPRRKISHFKAARMGL